MDTVMYCRFCRLPVWQEHCPICGSGELRPIRQEDLCPLVEKAHPWCDILADVLEQNGIAFHRSSVLGAGITSRIGIVADTERFYVPYGQLRQALELEEALFSGEAIPVEEE